MADVAKIGVWDPRLAPPGPAYAVRHGATSISAQQFAALSATTSQHNFNVLVPSLQTFVDRYVLWQSTFGLQFQSTYAAIPAPGAPVCVPGRDWALEAFPLHRLTTNISVTINDQSVNLNTNLVLTSLLRVADNAPARSIATTPVKLPVFASAGAGVGTAASAYGTITDAPYGVDPPNGAWPFVYCVPSGATVGGVGSVLSGAGSYTQATNGSVVNYVNGIPITSGAVQVYDIAVQVKVTEPLLVSPFTYGSPAAGYESAMSGINTLQVVMQMTTPVNARVCVFPQPAAAVGAVVPSTRFPAAPVGQSIGGYGPTNSASDAFGTSQLMFTFLTAPITLYLPAKSVVPFTNITAYPFTQTPAVTQAGPSDYFVSSNTITLPQIPDSLLIRLGPKLSDYGPQDAQWLLSIKKIVITFDNASGLLSNVPQETLWRMTTENGLQMPWVQWAGGATTASGASVQMSGGELYLAMGKDVQLFPTVAPGCPGNYAMNVQITSTIPPGVGTGWNPTLTIITVASGFFTLAGGQALQNTQPLDQEDVLRSAAESKNSMGRVHVTNSNLRRLVGGGWQASLANSAHELRAAYEAARPVGSAVTDAADRAGGPLGGAGRYSAGGRSAGAGVKRERGEGGYGRGNEMLAGAGYYNGGYQGGGGGGDGGGGEDPQGLYGYGRGQQQQHDGYATGLEARLA